MTPAQREWKDATRSTRIAAVVAVLGILVLSLGTKLIHTLKEPQHATAVDPGR